MLIYIYIYIILLYIYMRHRNCNRPKRLGPRSRGRYSPHGFLPKNHPKNHRKNEKHSTSGRPCRRDGSSKTSACQSTSPRAQLPATGGASHHASRVKHRKGTMMPWQKSTISSISSISRCF